MKRRTKMISVCVVLGLVVAGAVGAYTLHKRSIGQEALVTLGGQKVIYPDGRRAQIITAGNDYDQTTVVVVLHCPEIDPSRNVLVPGVTYSSDDPIGEMKSIYRLTTHYPPDLSISGLWIDGQEQAIGGGLKVFYISDRQAATALVIPSADQETFVDDANEMDPLEFIEKWVPADVLAKNE